VQERWQVQERQELVRGRSALVISWPWRQNLCLWVYRQELGLLLALVLVVLALVVLQLLLVLSLESPSETQQSFRVVDRDWLPVLVLAVAEVAVAETAVAETAAVTADFQEH
jgi:hypothetical protein